ncbi:MAG TPA: tetratricopeptide repeat protein, partial [bacterium]|nr:tetratricopeptide repeat protein [bacterium]
SLGKIENAQTLLSGSVKNYSYEENVTETKQKCYDKAYFKSCTKNAEEKCELQSKSYCREADDEEECEEKYVEVCEQDIKNECKDKSTRECVEYVRHGISDVDVSFNLIDIESGVNIITKVFDSNKTEETKSIDTQPQKINGKEMLRSSVNEIVDKYMKVISPYYVEEEVVFLKDKKVPILEEGINFVKIKDWKEAEKHFFMAIEKIENMPDVSNKIAAKPHWNLAMIYKYAGEFDKALIQIRKAYDISGNSSYLEEMENIKKRKEIIEKFEKKGQSTPDEE